jgi:hypothetical protein
MKIVNLIIAAIMLFSICSAANLSSTISSPAINMVGTVVTAPIQISYPDSLAGVELSLKWTKNFELAAYNFDNSIFRFIGDDDWVAIVDNTKCRIVMAGWFGVEGIPYLPEGAGNIVTFTFNYTGAGEPPEFEIYADTTYLSNNVHQTVVVITNNVTTGVTPDVLPMITSTSTDIEDPAEVILPGSFNLSQNGPNPFNPTTVINYAVPKASHITIVVYNALGQQVKTLVSRYQAAGYYSVSWNSTNDAGQYCASGMYFYRMNTNEFTSTKKMVMLK